MRLSLLIRSAILVTLLLAAGAPQAAAGEWELCARETRRQESDGGLPRGLLTAISLVESGRWHDGRRENLAWPWTVTSGGEGKFFPSKAAAMRYVEALQARGVRNIDVGCMQINLRYHPRAFDSLDEAFDPAANVAYAVRFLQRLRRDSASWTEAATAYHSRTPHLASRYRAKLMRAWKGREVRVAPTRVASLDRDKPTFAERRADARASAEAYREAVVRRYLERRRER